MCASTATCKIVAEKLLTVSDIRLTRHTHDKFAKSTKIKWHMNIDIATCQRVVCNLCVWRMGMCWVCVYVYNKICTWNNYSTLSTCDVLLFSCFPICNRCARTNIPVDFFCQMIVVDAGIQFTQQCWLSILCRAMRWDFRWNYILIYGFDKEYISFLCVIDIYIFMYGTWFAHVYTQRESGRVGDDEKTHTHRDKKKIPEWKIHSQSDSWFLFFRHNLVCDCDVQLRTPARNSFHSIREIKYYLFFTSFAHRIQIQILSKSVY